METRVGGRRRIKNTEEALYTALILDSNGCSRVVTVLVIARGLHTARVHRNVSAVDDNVAAAEGVLAAFHQRGCYTILGISRDRNGYEAVTIPPIVVEQNFLSG